VQQQGEDDVNVIFALLFLHRPHTHVVKVSMIGSLLLKFPIYRSEADVMTSS